MASIVEGIKLAEKELAKVAQALEIKVEHILDHLRRGKVTTVVTVDGQKLVHDPDAPAPEAAPKTEGAADDKAAK